MTFGARRDLHGKPVNTGTQARLHAGIFCAAAIRFCESLPNISAFTLLPMPCSREQQNGNARVTLENRQIGV